MKKVFFLGYLLIVCSLFTGIQAQSKKLSMEDAILGQGRQFYPENMSHLSWRGELNEYAYVEGDKLWAVQPAKKPKVILSLEDVNKALIATGSNKISHFPVFSWAGFNEIQFYVKNRCCQYSLTSGEIQFYIDVNKSASNKNYCEAGNKIAYTKENNLYFVGTDGEEIAVTNDADANFVNGQSVSRSEYGINGGIFWSPNGNYLAFYRKDESKVTSFPLVDINTRVGSLREEKYPMAGMNSEIVSLGVYNLKSKKTSWIVPEDFGTDQYLTNISWGPEEKYIYIQVLNRATNHVRLNKYEVASGAFVKTLLEEKDERWVEPSHTLTFLKSCKDQFIYQTKDRDGFNHLYLYTTEGKLVKQLTKGEWEVVKVLGFDKKEQNLFYISTEVSPLDKHAYKQNIKSGKRVRLTPDEGTHKVKVSADGKYIIDNYSSLHVPRKVRIADAKGKLVTDLLTAENKLKDYQLGEITLGKIKAADSKTDLYYRMVKPADFDPNKKYPVIVYVYGGPHSQLVTNTWMGGIRLWEQYMAQRGYVLFVLDNRGTAFRGKEFETVIHRQCGQVEMADQMKGVDFLTSLPYVDKDRIGVHGWSYGGFMTISLMTNYPDVFKVGVAGGPVIDWKWYEVMYGERYMDTPEENKEGYAKTSLLAKAKDLKGKLLICQGAIDKTVLWQHSLNFVRECIKNNVQVDYFPYPRAEHNVYGRDRIHLKQKVSNYFEDYLK